MMHKSSLKNGHEKSAKQCGIAKNSLGFLKTVVAQHQKNFWNFLPSLSFFKSSNKWPKKNSKVMKKRTFFFGVWRKSYGGWRKAIKSQKTKKNTFSEGHKFLCKLFKWGVISAELLIIFFFLLNQKSKVWGTKKIRRFPIVVKNKIITFPSSKMRETFGIDKLHENFPKTDFLSWTQSLRFGIVVFERKFQKFLKTVKKIKTWAFSLAINFCVENIARSRCYLGLCRSLFFVGPLISDLGKIF